MVTYEQEESGLIIKTHDIEHGEPSKCEDCGIISYFGGHLCPETERNKAMLRAIKGYFDG